MILKNREKILWIPRHDRFSYQKTGTKGSSGLFRGYMCFGISFHYDFRISASAKNQLPWSVYARLPSKLIKGKRMRTRFATEDEAKEFAEKYLDYWIERFTKEVLEI